MNFADNISAFLYDKKYHIMIYEDKLHVYFYKKLVKIAPNEAIIVFNNFKVIVSGQNLSIIRMNKEELLLQGQINMIRKYNE